MIHATRSAAGVWHYTYVDDIADIRGFDEMLVEKLGDVTQEEMDEILGFPAFTQPGDVWRSEEVYNGGRAGNTVRELCARFGVMAFSARVRSRRGLIGSLDVCHRAGREHSEMEPAIMSTLAELASIALS